MYEGPHWTKLKSETGKFEKCFVSQQTETGTTKSEKWEQ
jgi:hypothetical protein